VAADRGQISVRRRDRVPTLKALVSQITPENRYTETETGTARGKEALEW
jgi:antitoxin component of MazEF toxin-antitoxin module